MDSRKKRVLFVGEASFLSTGFSTYWNEVIKRLHSTNQFIIAEHGSYAHDNDPRCSQVPWKFYPNAPDPNDQQAMQIYQSNPLNQFGLWRFTDICLDFRPQIVCTLTDEWMSSWILKHPYRKYFKLCHLATIDGIPQKDEWLDDYKLRDYILTYSKWAMNDVLKKDGRKGTNLVTVASPCADIDVFKPVEDKEQHKRNLGIDPNSFIVGSVVRNQKRKLLYDLIEAFGTWYHAGKSKNDITKRQKTFLYLHTSYPDVGYDIGKAIREFKVNNKVLLTYLCGNCNNVFPSFFRGEQTICPKCKNNTAFAPNANKGVPRETLSAIYNLFDAYVQYSICWPKNTPILMSDYSYKNIQDIKIGDQVMTHENKTQEVTKIFKNKSDDAIEFEIYGDFRPYQCTSNHPIFTDRGFVSANRLKISQNKPRQQCDWIGFPIPTQTNKNLSIDPYLLGIMIGDGWYDNQNKFNISLGYVKKRAIKFINKYLKNKKFSSIDRYNGAVEYKWKNDNNLEPYIKYMDQKSVNKYLPYDIILCDNKYLSKLVAGLFDIDGHKNGFDLRYFSSSIQLIDQIRLILLKLGVISSINHHRKNKKSTDQNYKYVLTIKDKESKYILKNIINNHILINRKNHSKKDVFLKIQDGYLWSKIKSIKQVKIDGYVYNLEVEASKGGDISSHSYIVRWIAAHNCEGW